MRDRELERLTRTDFPNIQFLPLWSVSSVIAGCQKPETEVTMGRSPRCIPSISQRNAGLMVPFKDLLQFSNHHYLTVLGDPSKKGVRDLNQGPVFGIEDGLSKFVLFFTQFILSFEKNILFLLSLNLPFEQAVLAAEHPILDEGGVGELTGEPHEKTGNHSQSYGNPDQGRPSFTPDYSWDMLIRASNPMFSCGRCPVSLEPLSIRLNRLKNRTIESAINRIPARGTVTRRQIDSPVRNSHRFAPFHGPDSSSVHYPGAQDTRASLCHNRFQSVAP